MMTGTFESAIPPRILPFSSNHLFTLAVLSALLFYLTDQFIPPIIALGIGAFSYLIVPLILLFLSLLLVVIIIAVSNVDDSLNQLLYAVLISYLTTPLLHQQGWLGSSGVGQGIAYLMLFIISGILLNTLLQRDSLLKLAQPIALLVATGFLGLLFWRSTLKLIGAAGWLG